MPDKRFALTHPLVAELVAGLAARGVEARGDASGGTAVVIVLGRASHEGLRVGVPHGHVHELVGRGVAERKHLKHTRHAHVMSTAASFNAVSRMVVAQHPSTSTARN